MIANRLQEYLKFKGLSIHQAEQKANIGRGTLWRMVKNNSNISSSVLESFLTTFTDCNPTWLLTGTESMTIQNPINKDLNYQSDLSLKLDAIDKVSILNYISDNIEEFSKLKSYDSFVKVFATASKIDEISNEVEELKKTVAYLLEKEKAN
ncbi:hypothetical protein NBT05_02510 [Aquimarina sp. ERC-38]|uniref:hypothetical protein n=1 Tax=Aquimarina sp. ERC-38 TaxID=2949996 RepID=UPI002246BC23|nr:hypothetical protein [Aquimarina sp. ERC-38]UZO81354.1 hypothetical protein NBT05_02510 [Aquimarina sp. ERC-38]